MKFHVTYDYAPDDREVVLARFKETGAPPPDGVKMVGRWHSAEGNRGFLLAEADDVKAMAAWTYEWSDLLSFEIAPVLDDDEFSDVIG